MAFITKGILGGFSGKVGTVVGASWRGQDIIRSTPKKSDRQASESQLIQRLKFALVAQFLAPLRPILTAFFGQPQGTKSRRNLATSFHIREAIAGTYPDFTIDFTKVIITKGELLNAEGAQAVAQAGAQVSLTWTDNSGQGLSQATDGLLVIAYNDTRGMYDIREDAAARSAGAYTLELPEAWSGETVQVWISFLSEDAKRCANSMYMGAILLT